MAKSDLKTAAPIRFQSHGKRRWRASGAILVVASAVILLGAAERAHAIDVNASDYVPAPVGTNLLIFYSQYTTSNEYRMTIGNTIEGQMGLDTYVDTSRYVRYVDIFGLTSTLQVIVPVGTLYNARISGVSLDAAAGVADPILANGLWLLNDRSKGTYLGICQYLFIPVGQYDAGKSLNLGENRWKYDLQAGYYQDIGFNFAFQITGDVVFYGASDSTGTGMQRLTQDNTYKVQLWLSCRVDPGWSVGVGYSQYFGGTEYLDGVITGNDTEKGQIRMEMSKFITPTFQALGELQRDVNATAGFPESLRAMVRLTQVF